MTMVINGDCLIMIVAMGYMKGRRLTRSRRMEENADRDGRGRSRLGKIFDKIARVKV